MFLDEILTVHCAEICHLQMTFKKKNLNPNYFIINIYITCKRWNILDAKMVYKPSRKDY